MSNRVPDGWGERFRTKLQSGGKTTVAVYGESIEAGYFADLKENGYIGLIAKGLQQVGGDGGSGYQSTERSLVIPGTPLYADSIALTGTWDRLVTKFGPAGCSLRSTAHGSTATFHVRGSEVKIWYSTFPGLGQFEYSIDGGGPQPVDCNGSALTIAHTTTPGLTPGNHTVVVRKIGSPLIQLFGVSAESASGCVVNNFSRPGSSTDMMNNEDTVNFPIALAARTGRWSGGDLYPADLVIIGTFANDAISSIDPSQSVRNIRSYLEYVRTNDTRSNVDLLFVVKHIGRINADITYRWYDYVLRCNELAEVYGAAVVDLWSRWDNSYANFAAVNGWGDSASSTGAPGSDPIHLSNIGMRLYADEVLPVLLGQ
jgi:hypothetical protein